MTLITLDWETHWADDYTLKKMTTEAYVRDPRFKAHGVALKFDDAPAVWHPPSMLLHDRALRRRIESSAMLAHHAQFDGLILSHHFGLRPALWLDTLSMARIALPHHKHSLHDLSLTFGMRGKLAHHLVNTKNKTALTFDEMRDLGVMSCDDADKTYAIFQRIKDHIPPAEFRVIDMTIRMFTEPCLTLDAPKLEKYHAEEVALKRQALADLGLTKTDLGQDEKVAAAYRALGVEPDKKTTGKGNVKYAFAKTDEFMRDMLEDEDERVVALTEARLGVKSTLNETRCDRLLGMNARGALPVYLRYAGAHTTRWSGGDSLNWQNFPRRERDGRPGEIRGSILAPPGHKLVVGDLAQIECRILNWLAGEQRVLDEFAAGEDIYSNLASRFYGRKITKEDKTERQIFKSAELGCGYGMGAPRFEIYCRQSGVPITADQAQGAVDTYRNTHPHVRRMWRDGEFYLNALQAGDSAAWGPMEIGDGAIWLPNGVPLWYNHQRVENDERRVLQRGRWRYMYGPKLVENVVQALARVVLSEAMLKIAGRYRPVNTTHDEVVVIAPVDDAEALPYVLSTLRCTPTWAPGLPLDAEGAEGERYSK